MSGVPVTTCRRCGTRSFPPRIWCGACRSPDIETTLESFGALAEITTLRRARGCGGLPVQIGLVRLDGGGHVIARVEGATPPLRVRLHLVPGGIVARAVDT
jgi:uncharacterized OB-fold protein